MTDKAELEALAVRLEGLNGLLHDQIEINPSNYDHDDACRLNSEAVEIAGNGMADLPLASTAIRALLAENERLLARAEDWRQAVSDAFGQSSQEHGIARDIMAIIRKALQETDNAG